MSSRTKQSAMWEYFTLNLYDQSKVPCSVCAAVVSRGGKEMKNFNTSNMHHHLETKHPEEYKELEAKEKQLAQEKECNSLGISGSNQPMLIDTFARLQPLAFDHPRAKEISKRIGKMIALDNEPFTVVNHIGFN